MTRTKVRQRLRARAEQSLVWHRLERRMFGELHHLPLGNAPDQIQMQPALALHGLRSTLGRANAKAIKAMAAIVPPASASNNFQSASSSFNALSFACNLFCVVNRQPFP